jgi:isoleucyl-tRNA synthetase
LKELVVFHADPDYLEDVKSLERYIQSELNVRDVIFTSDEDTSGVKYRAVADWPVLGKKLRASVGLVKKALPDVSSAEIKEYIETGKLTVAGISLVAGDLAVQRYIALPAGSEQQYATQTDNDVVIRLDIKVHPELFAEWIAREVINRVQKLRKKATLKPTDDVKAYYKFNDDVDGKDLVTSIEQHAETITKACRNVPVNIKEQTSGTLVIEEEQEIADTKFVLSLFHV